MHYQSLIIYLAILFLGTTMLVAHANKEREKFTDLLQKRKHLTGYWVGKRDTFASDEDPFDSNDDLSESKRASYLVGKRGAYLVGKRASYLVGRKRRDLMDSTDRI